MCIGDLSVSLLLNLFDSLVLPVTDMFVLQHVYSGSWPRKLPVKDYVIV